MKHSTISLLAILIIVFSSTVASAGWLVFHKPAFRGKVIDAETKGSIEGAVVVAVYKTHSIIGTPAGGWSSVIKVKETLTDKSGEFSFPSYTTVMNPNATDYYTDFIIYRPGYGSFPNHRISPPRSLSRDTEENFFSADNFGKQGDVRIAIGKNRGDKRRVTYGVVELPQLSMKTRDERRKALPGGYPTDLTSENAPLLYKSINDERRKLGLGETN